MELPPPLRRAINHRRHLAHDPLRGSLSRRYSEKLHDGRLHLDDDQAGLAYLAARLSATFAALLASLTAAAVARRTSRQRSPSTWGLGRELRYGQRQICGRSPKDVLLVEGSPAARAWDERLSAKTSPPRIVWRAEDMTGGLPGYDPRDLVTLTYALGELAPAARIAIIDRPWQLTRDVFVIVEPGTPANWERILAARSRLN